MKNLTKIKVPKKYEDAIKSVEKGNFAYGKYLVELNEGFNNGLCGNFIYADTQAELLEKIRTQINEGVATFPSDKTTEKVIPVPFHSQSVNETIIEMVEEPSMTPQEHLEQFSTPMEIINQITFNRIIGFTLLETCRDLVEGGFLEVYLDPMEKALKAMGEMPKDEDDIFKVYVEVMSLALKNFYEKDLNIVVSAPLNNYYNTYGIVQFNRFIGFENNIMEVEHSSKEEPFEVYLDRYISACEGMTLEEMESFCKRHNDLEASKQYIKGGTK